MADRCQLAVDKCCTMTMPRKKSEKMVVASLCL